MVRLVSRCGEAGSERYFCLSGRILGKKVEPQLRNCRDSSRQLDHTLPHRGPFVSQVGCRMHPVCDVGKCVEHEWEETGGFACRF